MTTIMALCGAVVGICIVVLFPGAASGIFGIVLTLAGAIVGDELDEIQRAADRERWP